MRCCKRSTYSGQGICSLERDNRLLQGGGDVFFEGDETSFGAKIEESKTVGVTRTVGVERGVKVASRLEGSS